mmetsp:Transcript_46184/g.51493  ORF Transcript_46184/g.51493 Transcript_46184/m.51493 type:complete len:98 (+) Transcript_46184:50-343(+)
MVECFIACCGCNAAAGAGGCGFCGIPQLVCWVVHIPCCILGMIPCCPFVVDDNIHSHSNNNGLQMMMIPEKYIPIDVDLRLEEHDDDSQPRNEKKEE